jgi:hypothetical protein
MSALGSWRGSGPRPCERISLRGRRAPSHARRYLRLQCTISETAVELPEDAFVHPGCCKSCPPLVK